GRSPSSASPASRPAFRSRSRPCPATPARPDISSSTPHPPLGHLRKLYQGRASSAPWAHTIYIFCNPAAVGKRLLEHQTDYGEQSFRWAEEARALAQGTIAGPQPFRPALRPSPPALLLLDDCSRPLRKLPLDG